MSYVVVVIVVLLDVMVILSQHRALKQRDDKVDHLFAVNASLRGRLSCAYESVSSYRHDLDIALTALSNISTQNDNDPYFKVWAKQIATEAIQRVTHATS